jgi:hypothetical protein
VPSEDRAQFQLLIQEQLSGVKVYRVGDEPEPEVCVVGMTKDAALRWDRLLLGRGFSPCLGWQA